MVTATKTKSKTKLAVTTAVAVGVIGTAFILAPRLPNNSYSEAYVECYDSTSTTLRGSCLSSRDWRVRANMFCQGASNNAPSGTISKKGVNTFAVSRSCR